MSKNYINHFDTPGFSKNDFLENHSSPNAALVPVKAAAMEELLDRAYYDPLSRAGFEALHDSSDNPCKDPFKIGHTHTLNRDRAVVEIDRSCVACVLRFGTTIIPSHKKQESFFHKQVTQGVLLKIP